MNKEFAVTHANDELIIVSGTDFRNVAFYTVVNKTTGRNLSRFNFYDQAEKHIEYLIALRAQFLAMEM